MQGRRYILPVAFFLIIFFNPQPAYPNKEIKTIVVFFSLNAHLPAYQNIMEGFKSTLSQDSDEPYNLLVEYLDVGRSSDETYVKHIVDLYNEKLKEYQIDLLITVGPLTYSLLKKDGLEALVTTPTIKIELDPPIENPVPAFLNKNSIEIKLKLNARETLNHIFELFPDHRDVDIISGNTHTDLYFISLIKKDIQGFQRTHHFNFISGMTLDSILLLARKIPAGHVVIIPTYLSDKNNVPFSTPEAIRLISNNCKAPVFPMFDSFIKTKGGIGGYLFVMLRQEKRPGE